MSEFTWGVATAAYQIEGAVDEDGRSESIWDRFCATPGKVRAGDTGAIACDFYHRYPEDIELMRDLGIGAFRFSIAWPRVMPDGRGRVNAAGLDFYDRLVDDLLAAGIQPFPTLYHWDLPQALEDEGGWRSRATAQAFVEYTEAVVARLGDRVTHWMTHNEPWVVAWLGYGLGVHAPGRTSEQEAVDAAHHVLLSHGWAVEAIRREAPEAQVGIVLNLEHVDSASDSEADRAAAWQMDGRANRWFLDPIFKGFYPEDVDYSPPVQDGDLAAISTPIDFLGVNNYFRFVVSEGPTVVELPGVQRTSMGWEVHPDGLYKLLLRVAKDYAPKAIYVTENGAAFEDVRGHDGSVRDPERTEYLAGHIDAVWRARKEGAPVEGYFVWSFLDNFEWAEGYSKRFGIVFVDYPTQERVPKDSFHWFKQRIRSLQPA
ncbi:MAG: GH1 family beta-glucosidase [Actinomycetota bacterium]